MIDFDARVNAPISRIFGEELIYQPAGGGKAKDVPGVFTDAYKTAFQDGEGGVGWVTTAPSAGFRLADLPRPPAKDDRVTRKETGESFLVFEQQPDGMGWVHLKLKKL
ncbi:hypothetical protein DDE05_00575 [Streptomyces cavourensis]|nr:hypothetical protein DDE05_00575 [Streptomyces cavourensis]